MSFFTDFDARVAALRDLLPGDVTVETLGVATQSLSSETVLKLTRVAADVQQSLDQLKLVLSAEIRARSGREFGHQGLAQSQGFRSPVELIQKVSGVSRSVAQQQIRVGAALLDHGCDAGAGADGVLGTDGDGDCQVDSAGAISGSWFAPLVQAMRSGDLTLAQHDAIRRGLGEPPVSAADTDADVNGAGSADGAAVLDAAGTAVESVPDPGTVAAWSLAAVQLTEYAAEVPVEELVKQARAVRDLLDPVGMEARFAARYERRSFSLWTDADGFTHGKFIFDDESAEWVRTLIDSALRPRRGGPRFVTVDERAKAAALVKDPRTIDQLTHDLLIDVLRAGSIADASTVLGARQAGIKLVQVVDRDEYLAEVQAKAEAEAGAGGAGAPGGAGGTGTAGGAVGAGDGTDARGSALHRAASTTRLLESGTVLPVGAGDAHKCRTGQQTVIVDRTGDPLNVGREQRLFTTSQRVALSVRDGGCRWTGCDRPASYCEAHHIDEWTAEHGRTDIDRGVLLCRFHHMQLHNKGWRITREDRGPFLLHPPSTRDEAEQPPGQQHLGAVGDPSDRPPGREHLGVGDDSPDQRPGRGDHSAVGDPLDRPPGTMQPFELRPPLPLSYAWQSSAPAKKKFPTAA